jgi:hypothetical protein
MCIGNFNEVLHKHEHESVAEWSLAQIEGFRETVDVCELADLGYKGISWTLEKRDTGGQFCRVHLDRALATSPWSGRFYIRHLTASTSDHYPIFFRWRETVPQWQSTKDKIFRCELMWESHDDLKPCLKEEWQAGGVCQEPTTVTREADKRGGVP